MMRTESWTTSAAIKQAALIASAFLLALIANLTALGWSVERTEAGGVLTELSMAPLTNIEPAGSDIVIDILIDGITDFGSYELDIAYDPNVLQFNSWDANGLLDSTGRSQVCQDPSFPSPGIVVLACSSVDQRGPQGATGSGGIGELTFNTSCSGQSMITFRNTTISDTAGVEILHSQASVSFVLLTPVVDSEPCLHDTTTPEQPDEGSLTPTPTPTPPPTPPPIDTPTPPTPTSPNDCGDVNSTGTVDAVDAALVLFKIARIIPNVANPNNADVDGNGRLDSIDVLQILQVIAGLISHNALSCR